MRKHPWLYTRVARTLTNVKTLCLVRRRESRACQWKLCIWMGAGETNIVNEHVAVGWAPGKPILSMNMLQLDGHRGTQYCQ